MKAIPISEGERIAKKYGYDQIVILGRKVGEGPEAGEHLTTYGVTKIHCDIAARIGRTLAKVMGWTPG